MSFFGSAYWRFIHYFAIHNIGRDDLLRDIVNFLPCEECKNEWENPSENENLVEWSLRLHNKVNTKLGKWDKWDMTDFNISQKPQCDYCMDKDTMYMFPWGFIHAIASLDITGVVDFLKAFDTSYPCDTCRGTFLIEDKNDSETVFEWTVRNHKRMNRERGFDEMRGVISLPGDCKGCDGVRKANITRGL
jgi:hypothetical protein